MSWPKWPLAWARDLELSRAARYRTEALLDAEQHQVTIKRMQLDHMAEERDAAKEEARRAKKEAVNALKNAKVNAVNDLCQQIERVMDHCAESGRVQVKSLRMGVDAFLGIKEGVREGYDAFHPDYGSLYLHGVLIEMVEGEPCIVLGKPK